MSYTQVKLVSRDGKQMTTWVDSDPRLKRGRVIELKKDNRLWMVEEVYSTMDEVPNHHGFDNNNYDKHEGLFNKGLKP